MTCWSLLHGVSKQKHTQKPLSPCRKWSLRAEVRSAFSPTPTPAPGPCCFKRIHQPLLKGRGLRMSPWSARICLASAAPSDMELMCFFSAPPPQALPGEPSHPHERAQRLNVWLSRLFSSRWGPESSIIRGVCPTRMHKDLPPNRQGEHDHLKWELLYVNLEVHQCRGQIHYKAFQETSSLMDKSWNHHVFHVLSPNVDCS